MYNFSSDEIRKTRLLIERSKRIRGYVLGLCIPSTFLNVFIGFMALFGSIIPWWVVFLDIAMGIATAFALAYILFILAITK